MVLFGRQAIDHSHHFAQADMTDQTGVEGNMDKQKQSERETRPIDRISENERRLIEATLVRHRGTLEKLAKR